MAQIPKKVQEQLESIRSSGRAKLLDYEVVLVVAKSEGYAETTRWMKRHKPEYVRTIIGNFDIVGN